jgi:hypothetical protein
LSEREKHLDKQLSIRNQYPKEVIERVMPKYLAKFVDMSSQETHMEAEVSQNKRKKKLITLPYAKRKCEEFAFSIRKLVNETFQ